MVGAGNLKSYGFKSIEEYFDMTIRSWENGQFDQMKEQIHKLDWEQKKAFLKYLFESFYLSKLISDTGFLYITSHLFPGKP